MAGVAALIKSEYPSLAPELVASALTSTTTDRPTGGYDSQVGFGVVNAAAALAKAGAFAHSQFAHGQSAHGQPAEAQLAGTGVATAARFHGTVAPEPVRPRGSSQLVLFALLALASLVLTAAGIRLTVLARTPQ